MNEDLHRPPYPMLPRAIFESLTHRLRLWASSELLRPLMEPVLHPSQWRIRALGVSTMVGHPLFWVLWSDWLPQPYESFVLRMLMALAGLSLLVIPGITSSPPSRSGRLLHVHGGSSGSRCPGSSRGCTSATAATPYGWPAWARCS